MILFKMGKLIVLVIFLSFMLFSKPPIFRGDLILVHPSYGYLSEKAREGINEIAKQFINNKLKVISLVNEQSTIELLARENISAREANECLLNKDNYYRYNPSILQSEVIYLLNGNMDYIPKSDIVTMAGGYWQWCFNNTLLDVIINSKFKKNIKIQIPIPAIFGAGAPEEFDKDYITFLIKHFVFPKLIQKGLSDFVITLCKDGNKYKQKISNGSLKYNIEICFYSDTK